jgi:hypothetical protein
MDGQSSEIGIKELKVTLSKVSNLVVDESAMKWPLMFITEIISSPLELPRELAKIDEDSYLYLEQSELQEFNYGLERLYKLIMKLNAFDSSTLEEDKTILYDQICREYELIRRYFTYLYFYTKYAIEDIDFKGLPKEKIEQKLFIAWLADGIGYGL